MKVAFFSNFLNHHQLPLCMEFLKRENVEFTFVATLPIEQERLDMGYTDMNKAYPFVLRAYESEENLQKAQELAQSCDLMIFGAAPLLYLEQRMRVNKMAFYFCERILKKGYWRRFIPTTYLKIHKAYLRYKRKPLYILTASAYCSYDLKLCGFDEKKCFKWGYFPDIKEKNLDEIFSKKRKKEKVEILYAGRLLGLKRVMDTVQALKFVKGQGLDNFNFTIIGDGEQKKDIEKYIQEHNLKEYIRLLPFMPAEKVREYMASADIYVFSSNRYEGWGAVVNEAMNSACAMVVSHTVGSVPYLIEDEKNGLVYECGNVEQLAQKLSALIKDTNYRERLAIEAYNTVVAEWNAKNAAEKLIRLYEELIQGRDGTELFKNGVCSLAIPLKDDWIKKK